MPSNTSAWYMFQHTAARRRLALRIMRFRKNIRFQHTAARRRLADLFADDRKPVVSTHSRPKAAGFRKGDRIYLMSKFQHTAARRRLGTFLGLGYAG